MTHPERDQEFFSRLEKVLDEQFPKIEEEGPEKKANQRGAALVLFAEANRIHSQRLHQVKLETVRRIVEVAEIMRINPYGIEDQEWKFQEHNQALSALQEKIKQEFEI